MAELMRKFQQLKHNLIYYSEFYATIFGFFLLQLVTYIVSYYSSQQNLVVEATVRLFFTIIFFILVMLIEQEIDFYQFRWLTVLCINQCLILCSTSAWQVHTFILTGIIVYPYMEMLRISDLKRVDPLAILAQKQNDSDDVLPTGGLAQRQVKRDKVIIKVAYQFMISIALLWHLMSYKEELTPDFFHFVVNLKEEFCHSIWIIGIWSIFKCFLNDQEDNNTLQLRALFFLIQGVIGITLSNNITFSTLAILTIYLVISFIREKYPIEVNWLVIFFLILYFLQNFVVNLIDLIIFRTILNSGGYYHDDEFLKSFSYRVFQAFICLIFSVLYTQVLKPFHEKIVLIPQILDAIFKITIPSSFCMFFVFLYELTYEPAAKRSKVYRSELTKVFFSILFFYFISMIFANWIQSLRKFINIQHKRLEQYNLQKAKATTVETEQLLARIKLEKNDIKVGKKPSQTKFTLQNFTLYDILDISLNQFDQFLIEQCSHFRDVEFMNVMRSIQNSSAVIFFLLIHIPLARISSFFSLLTTWVPLILNKRNKETIYLNAFNVVAMLSRDKETDPPVILRRTGELAQQYKARKYEEFRENQKAAINITVFYLGIFVALMFNYIYICYLGKLTSFICESLIRIFDRFGFEVHFVRLIYYTIFDQSSSDSNSPQSTDLLIGMIVDHISLIVIIIPLFILSIRYLTAQSHKHYSRSTNALLAPIAVIPMFYFQNYDVIILAALVLFANLWVAWKQLDSDEYSWASAYRDQYERSTHSYGASKYTHDTSSYYNNSMEFDHLSQIPNIDPMSFGLGSGMISR